MRRELKWKLNTAFAFFTMLICSWKNIKIQRTLLIYRNRVYKVCSSFIRLTVRQSDSGPDYTRAQTSADLTEKGNWKTWLRIPQHISKKKLKVLHLFLQVRLLLILQSFIFLQMNFFYSEKKVALGLKFSTRHKMDRTIE